MSQRRYRLQRLWLYRDTRISNLLFARKPKHRVIPEPPSNMILRKRKP